MGLARCMSIIYWWIVPVVIFYKRLVKLHKIAIYLVYGVVIWFSLLYYPFYCFSKQDISIGFLYRLEMMTLGGYGYFWIKYLTDFYKIRNMYWLLFVPGYCNEWTFSIADALTKNVNEFFFPHEIGITKMIKFPSLYIGGKPSWWWRFTELAYL